MTSRGWKFQAFLIHRQPKQKPDLSIRLISGFDAFGHQVLQPPEMGVVDAHLFEMVDGGVQIFGHGAAGAGGAGQHVGNLGFREA